MSKQETNAIKGLAVILLLFHHLFYRTTTYDGFSVFFAGGEKEQQVITGIAVICKVCVAVFAFVSAYGLSRQYEEKAILSCNSLIAKDAVNRYLKLIINAFCIYMPFSVLAFILNKNTIVQVYHSDSILVSIKYFFFDILGVAYFFDTPKFNDSWWYLGLAILIILTVPIINLVYKKIGCSCIFLVLLILPLFEGVRINYFDYLLGLVIAVHLANRNTIEKYKKYVTGRTLQLVIIVLLLLSAIIGCSYLIHKEIITAGYADNILACLIVFLVVSLSQIKFMEYPIKGLSFLGRLSMNIYLCHTFIYSRFFKPFIFSFKYWWLILFVLLLITSVISWVLEKLKTTLGLYKLIDIISCNVLKTVR